MRKGAAAVTVAQRPDAGDVRFEIVVDNDVAARIRRNTSFVEVQITCVGNAPYCEKEVAARHLGLSLLTVHAYINFLATLRDGNALRVQTDAYALHLQNVAHRFRNVLVFTANDPR